ncbi:MAG: hypothetical protein ABIY70_05415, partial [Capsulimonas sp.]|uniref:hypothetical protein n=1 Tax=Capsulimonas sp. TaxID=2494211 RepID=UPI003265D628
TVSQGRDASLLNRRPQIFAAPQQETPLSAEVRSVGYSRQTAQLDLIEAGKTLQTKTITLDDHHPSTVLFTVHQDKEGVYPYTMALHGMPGEVTLSNNKSTAYLQVLKSKARVLVLEARPSWDAKFLIQALHTDPSIEVDSIFKLTSDKTFAVAGSADTASAQKPREITVPRTAADFAKYDVVVIGKGYEDFFDPPSTEALKTFVSDHSGNVIFLRGNPGKQTGNLSALEPLQWSSEEIQDVRMKVTDEGRRNPAFNFSATPNPDLVIQKLPTLISATKVEGEKSLSVVLARASGSPSGNASQEMAMIAYQNYGQGKAVSVVGEGLWRWALLPPDMKDYGGCYNDFWTQLVRWLVNQSDFLPGQDLSLKTDRASYSPNQPVSLMAFVRGKAKASVPPVTIVLPNGKTEHVTLARGGSTQANFVGSFKAHAPGEYTAWLGRPNGGSLMVPFSVFPSSEEDLVTAADPEMMHQIAEAGGGEMLAANDLDQLPLKLKDSLQVISRKTDSQSAWDRGPILAILLAIFTIEWILRRRAGLL